MVIYAAILPEIFDPDFHSQLDSIAVSVFFDIFVEFEEYFYKSESNPKKISDYETSRFVNCQLKSFRF